MPRCLNQITAPTVITQTFPQFENFCVFGSRQGMDVGYGLHQFVLIETKKTVSKKELKSMLDKQHGVQDFQVKMEWKQQQQLTHQKICFYFLVIKINTKIKIANYHWVKSSQLETLAFPRTLQQAVQKIITAIRL